MRASASRCLLAKAPSPTMQIFNRRTPTPRRQASRACRRCRDRPRPRPGVRASPLPSQCAAAVLERVCGALPRHDAHAVVVGDDDVTGIDWRTRAHDGHVDAARASPSPCPVRRPLWTRRESPSRSGRPRRARRRRSPSRELRGRLRRCREQSRQTYRPCCPRTVPTTRTSPGWHSSMATCSIQLSPGCASNVTALPAIACARVDGSHVGLEQTEPPLRLVHRRDTLLRKTIDHRWSARSMSTAISSSLPVYSINITSPTKQQSRGADDPGRLHRLRHLSSNPNCTRKRPPGCSTPTIFGFPGGTTAQVGHGSPASRQAVAAHRAEHANGLDGRRGE